MSKKAQNIKFGKIYCYPTHIALWDESQKFHYGMILSKSSFIPIDFLQAQRWERYGGFHRCIKVITNDGIVGCIFININKLEMLTT